jgi:uncharacterized protein
MKLWFVGVAACWLLLGAAAVAATDCSQAATPFEKAICGQADLHQMDADLNRLYSGLRPQLTARARTELLTQQRAWLAQRDRDCASGEANCLRTHYRARLEELQALNATAEAGDEKLDDVTPVIVKGKWKATAIRDPNATGGQGAGEIDKAGLQASLASANLPAIGAVVDAAPGKLCLPPQPCDSMGWAQKKLAEVDDSAAIGRYLGLNSTIRVLVGSSGATQSYYLLVPRSDGTLWAVFALCSTDLQDCRKAAELWTPASADAAVLPGS